MAEVARLPEAGESIGGLASLLVSCIAEEERLLDSICHAADDGDGEAVLSLARQLSSLRTTTTGPKLSEGSR
jgi:hypothetical protein